MTWDELGGVRAADDLRFAPEQVLDRIEEYGDLAADLLVGDPPALPPLPEA